MYRAGISHLGSPRAEVDRKKICAVMVAAGWLGLGVPAAFGQEAAENEAAAEAKTTSADGAGERAQSAAAAADEPRPEGVAAAPSEPQVVTVQQEAPQNQQVCRKIEQTGTHFSRRECRTVAQWKAIDARTSAQGRRITRDVQNQSTVMPPPGPGSDTAVGRPSGLPNPGGF